MDAVNPPTSPTETTDIFSLSDQVLSESLQFIEEIGFGNWGSVWLCTPKRGSQSATSSVPEQKIAVKLVHRSKTSTTAARVRSLWNEMKIVRSFKSDPHPSIIPFHSFIITPSYALITMTYLPTLIPVEVDESKAKSGSASFYPASNSCINAVWPANILISQKSIPVLVDFGFAEKYDLDSDTAFHSNLSYGTPEYLSPERARGLPHDTRKSDIWSLGVTFFEILTGRTPFEQSDGEQFTSKEDLEKYWARTLRGKWIGTWKMSQGMEKLLQRMIAPNADLRCTASQAIVHSYWKVEKEAFYRTNGLRAAHPPLCSKEILRNCLILLPPGRKRRISLPRPVLTKSKSQLRAAATKVPPRKRMPLITDLSPVKASPPASPLSLKSKENIATFNALATSVNSNRQTGSRKPFGVVAVNSNLPRPRLAAKPSTTEVNKNKRKVGILADLQKSEHSKENSPGDWPRAKDSTSVRDRMREWEREKQRLREAERLDELERDRDERLAKDVEELEPQPPRPIEKDGLESPRSRDKEVDISIVSTPPVLPLPTLTSPLTQAETPARPSSKGSHRNIFKHSIKKSIDKTVQLYKSSTFGQVTPDLQEASIRNSAQMERVAADAQADRLTIWMRNVEKVVEDARQNFAAASVQESTLPSLPVPPSRPVSRNASQTTSQPRSNRSSRLPRKVLAASQIFTEENIKAIGDQSFASNATSTYATANTTGLHDISVYNGSTPVRNTQLVVPEIHTPSRQRRATVSTGSPEAAMLFDGSPSKRKEKSKSHGNLFDQRIARLSLIEAELNKVPAPEPSPSSPRLSQVVDRNLVIRTPFMSRELLLDDVENMNTPEHRQPSFDELTSSPCHVEPYQPRKFDTEALPDTPSQRRLEGVYDRFLMATSGVKRVGKGYQSDNIGPIGNNNTLNVQNIAKRDSHRAFYSARKPMPPPVSSDDVTRAASVDELGFVAHSNGVTNTSSSKDDSHNTVALVRRAIKAMVPGKATVSRRLSRMA
ncbi:hypothetical protein BDQ17DRAFT_1321088 [Cyathus striatus]|nr:hypothetical protein BDQ17DRAFT_1321088 [Cyathus striatus]